MADILVNITLVLIMAGIGMSLTFNDFKNVFVYPKSILTGIGSQLLILPALSFCLAYLAPVSAAEKLGIVLIALCPVGTTSNILIHIFKGNTALSISMTIFNSMLSPFSIPFFIAVAVSFFVNEESNVSMSFSESFVHILLTVILPAFCGLMVRRYFTKVADYLSRPLKWLLPLLLLIVFSIKIFLGNNETGCTPMTMDEILKLAPFVLLLNILGMYGGFFIAKLSRLDKPSQLTVAIETGLQNTALALSVAATPQGACEIEKPALVYAMLTFFTAVVFLLIHSGMKVKDVFGKKEGE